MALNYFEPFINKVDLYQSFDFLEEWPAFVQKLLNLFGLYLPKDDNKDAIVKYYTKNSHISYCCSNLA